MAAKRLELLARKIVLSGDIDCTMFAELSTQLAAYEADSRTEPVMIEINSEGGATSDALAIVGRLRASPCPIHTVGYGKVMSAATLIYAAGSTRIMSRYAWFMIHDASDQFKGSVPKIKAELKQLEREELQWIELLELFTGVPKALWAELTANSTHLTAEDCKKLLIADELI